MPDPPAPLPPEFSEGIGGLYVSNFDRLARERGLRDQHALDFLIEHRAIVDQVIREYGGLNDDSTGGLVLLGITDDVRAGLLAETPGFRNANHDALAAGALVALEAAVVTIRDPNGFNLILDSHDQIFRGGSVTMNDALLRRDVLRMSQVEMDARVLMEMERRDRRARGEDDDDEKEEKKEEEKKEGEDDDENDDEDDDEENGEHKERDDEDDREREREQEERREREREREEERERERERQGEHGHDR